ncbi:hypothetical protein DXG01_002072 [Tephrocybe rancida]|nr:hypothetical protein DXG01_002072 [Tephrocybe rancida]
MDSIMSEKNLRQRKSESRDGDKKKQESAKSTEAAPKSTSSSSVFSKGFVGLAALVLAALLYNSEFFWQTIAPLRQGPPRLPADVEKRDTVVGAFKHAWLAYERDAMGDDNYHPISKRGSNLTDAGGIGYTVVDSLDTIQLMGLTSEYAQTDDTRQSTIRVMGGLLSAYHLSGSDSLYLERATELADRIMPVFNSPSGLPLSEVNLGKRTPVENPNNVVSTAEAASIQLELRYLSHLTENVEYWDKAENVMKIIKAARLSSGLASIFMASDSGQFLTSQVRLGSRGDSYYEYLLKQYLQTAQTEPVYREMYDDSMTAVHKSLLRTSLEKNLTYSVELVPEALRRGKINWNTEHKQDHLVCFIGGNLMLGATTSGASVARVSVPPLDEELTEAARRDWQTGVAMLETCVDTYKRTATGLAPEIVHFRHRDEREKPKGNGDWYIKDAQPAGRTPPYDARYLLRPETVESLFLAYRLTGDVKYRQYGWDIFQSIEKYCRVETGGYATILNVDDVNSKLEDRMESFMLSETLKYLYLLFSDSNVIPLDKYVFNTEAHPLPIFTPHSKRAWSTSS